MSELSEPGALMESEMREQPQILASFVDRRPMILEQLAPLASSVSSGILFVARGSSDNAALAGRYAVEMTSAQPAGLAAPSLHTRYRTSTRLDGWLVVGVSQSGKTPEVVDNVRSAQQAGARTIGVTNNPDSALADAVEILVALGCGIEEAVPATKTFTATTAAMLIIAEAFGPAPWTEQWEQLPTAATVCLATEPTSETVSVLADSGRILVVARGILTAAAHETALKIQETSRRPVHAYSTSDLYHGPITSFGEHTAAVVIGSAGPTAKDAIDVANRMRQLGANTITVGSAEPEAELPIPRMHDALSVITATIRGQQLALALARHLKLDPDQPSGLSKVTRTH